MEGQDLIAAAVLRELHRRRMTTTQLADILDLDRTSVSCWLAGRRGIRLASVIKVMGYLDLRVFGGMDAPQNHSLPNRPPPPRPGGTDR